MCAIVGWQSDAAATPPEDLLARMSERLRHRGPDDMGDWRDDAAGIAFGHRRLSIIDLSAASHQPMRDAATGVVLSYNGELYNFRTVRDELAALGHRFTSTGDTEVVLRSYMQWGMECLPRLAGMFAFSIWDPRSRTLHLARDAMGIKPLYYLPQPRVTYFASELKALCLVPGFTPALDDAGLAQYLEFGYVFDSHRTMLRGIRKLPPGTRLEVRDGAAGEPIAWFAPGAPDPQDRRGEAERVDEFARTLTQVTREHLIADVPVGMLLSGGIDSGVVAALAAREGPLHTVTMAFADSDVDERAAAREASSHIGSRHTEILIRPDEVRSEVERGAWVFDDLFSDWGAVTTRLLYRRCREIGIKVVLVGEGADELLGGYDVFDLPPKLGPWRMFRLYQRYAGRRWGRLFGEFDWIMRGYLRDSGGVPFDAVRLFESRRQLPNQYVMKVDKASMAESVEARAPYLDRRVAEQAYRTPAEWLQRGGENKWLLRAVARKGALLPESSCARRKFGAPLAATWMDRDAGLRHFASERMLDSGSQTRRLGFAPAMHAYLSRGLSGQPFPMPLSVFRLVAWRLLLLELWAPHYLAKGSA